MSTPPENGRGDAATKQEDAVSEDRGLLPEDAPAPVQGAHFVTQREAAAGAEPPIRAGRTVKLEALHAYYGGTHAVKGVDLLYEANKVTAMIGPSAVPESPLEQPIGDPGLRVDLIHLGEWKDIGRINEVEKRTRIARRLRELVVEAAPPASGDVGPHAVEDAPAAFVLVEPKVREGPQKPAALRTAES